MSDLSGSLSSFQLQQLAGFLSGLQKSGDLLLACDHWIGSLSFDNGALIAATVETEHGSPALEFIGTFMRRGLFEFFEGAPQQPANLEGSGAAALELLRRVVSDSADVTPDDLPGPAAVPRLVRRDGRDDGDILVARASLYILVDIDGARSVRDIVTRHGLAPTLRALTRLRNLGIIDFDPGAHDDPPTSGISGSALRARTRGAFPSRSPAPGQSSLPATRAEDTAAPDWRRYLPQRLRREVVRDLAQAVLVTGVLVVSVRSLVENFRVEGVSMQPNFTAGEVIVVNRAAYIHLDRPVASVTASPQAPEFPFGGPSRGDVAVFRSPAEPDTNYIKRIIGLPGDSVLIKSGHVFVNDSALTEDYIEFPADYVFPGDGQPVVVPDGTYFVLGDNRPDSFDSHTGWVVPADNLIGRAWLRYWPPDVLGVVQNAAPALASAGSATASN